MGIPKRAQILNGFRSRTATVQVMGDLVQVATLNGELAQQTAKNIRICNRSADVTDLDDDIQVSCDQFTGQLSRREAARGRCFEKLLTARGR